MAKWNVERPAVPPNNWNQFELVTAEVIGFDAGSLAFYNGPDLVVAFSPTGWLSVRESQG